jgi:hypothetical protein
MVESRKLALWVWRGQIRSHEVPESAMTKGKNTGAITSVAIRLRGTQQLLAEGFCY